jgi:hypothetical protein
MPRQSKRQRFSIEQRFDPIAKTAQSPRQGVTPQLTQPAPDPQPIQTDMRSGLPTRTLGSVPEGLLTAGGTPEEIVNRWDAVKDSLTKEQIAAMGPLKDVKAFDIQAIGTSMGLSQKQISNIADTELQKQARVNTARLGIGETRDLGLRGGIYRGAAAENILEKYGRREGIDTLYMHPDAKNLSDKEQFLLGLRLKPGEEELKLNLKGNWDVHNLMGGGSMTGNIVETSAPKTPENIEAAGKEYKRLIREKMSMTPEDVGQSDINQRLARARTLMQAQPDKFVELPSGDKVYYTDPGSTRGFGQSYSKHVARERSRLKESHKSDTLSAGSIIGTIGKIYGSVVLGLMTGGIGAAAVPTALAGTAAGTAISTGVSAAIGAGGGAAQAAAAGQDPLKGGLIGAVGGGAAGYRAAGLLAEGGIAGVQENLAGGLFKSIGKSAISKSGQLAATGLTPSPGDLINRAGGIQPSFGAVDLQQRQVQQLQSNEPVQRLQNRLSGGLGSRRQIGAI